MSPSYRKSHLSATHAHSYHEAFSRQPYRNMLWLLEQSILNEIIDIHYSGRNISHMDFACGTGRVLNHLSKKVFNSVGVDVSESMLEVARSGNALSELINADLTENDVLDSKLFNLITAFRFFPNAEKELRDQSMAVIVRHLSDDGLLVFNNHKCTDSAGNILALKLGRRRDYGGMSRTEVAELLAKHGLKVVRIYALGIFPSSESRTLLPVPLVWLIEKTLLKYRAFQRYGEDLIYVCKKVNQSSW